MKETRVRRRWRVWLTAALGIFCAAIILWPSDDPPQRRLGVLRAQENGLASASSSPPSAERAPVPTAESADLGEDGGGVAGVVVDALGGAAIPDARVYWLSPSLRELPVTKCTLTDDRGAFVLEAERDQPARNFRVLASGYTPWTSGPITSAVDGVVVRLERGEAIHGRVVDLSGRAVEGARVWCHSPRNRLAWPAGTEWLPGMDEGVPVGAESVSGASGEFVLKGLETGKYELRAAKRFHAFEASESPPLVDSGSDGVTVVLLPTARLEVNAVDAKTGAPLRHALLSLKPGRDWRQTLDSMTHEIPAGAEGRDTPISDRGTAIMTLALRHATVDLPEVTVLAMAPGYMPTRRTVPLPPGAVTRVELPLERVAGSDSANGAVRFEAQFRGGGAYDGVLFVEVREVSEGRSVGMLREAFVDGRSPREWEFAGGHYALVVRGPMGASGAFALSGWGANVPLSVVPGEAEVVRLELTANPVELSVADSRGRRIRGFDLTVNSPFGGGIRRRWDVGRTLEEGPNAQPIVWVPAGDVALAVSMPGFGRATWATAAPGDGTRLRVDLVLSDDMRDADLSDPERAPDRGESEFAPPVEVK